MNDDRYTPADRSMQDMRNMTDLERKTAVRQQNRQLTKSAKKRKPSQKRLFGLIPVRRKKRRWIYAFFAALAFEIRQAKERTAAKKAQRKKAAEALAIETDQKRQARESSRRATQTARQARISAASSDEKLLIGPSGAVEIAPQVTPHSVQPDVEDFDFQTLLNSVLPTEAEIDAQISLDSALPEAEEIDTQFLLNYMLPEDETAEPQDPSEPVQPEAEDIDFQALLNSMLPTEAEIDSQISLDSALPEAEEIDTQFLLNYMLPDEEEDAPQPLLNPAVPVAEEMRFQQPDETQLISTETSSDENEKEPVAAASRKQRSDKKIWITAVLIFCSIVLATLIFLGVRSMTAANDFRKLSQQIQEKEAELTATLPTEEVPAVTAPPSDDEVVTETVPEETEPVVRTILPKYADLVVQNPELFGWVRVDDTVLDYPVMRSSMDNEKYLYANFDGKYSFAGTPFADNQCTSDSDNILIYGHNIKDGSMFRSLFKYEKESYWKKHPTIMYSDLYEDYEYEVMAVFYDRIYKKTEDVFKFYQFIDADSEEDFNYAVEQFKSKSLYDTGVDAQYGDQLITLVTCSYQVENGRFVVVARRK